MCAPVLHGADMPQMLRFLTLSALVAAPALAATPLQLTHNGYLLDSSDVPVTDTLQMTFKVFPADAGTTQPAVWNSGAACPVPVSHGYYAVVLGGECGTALTSD